MWFEYPEPVTSDLLSGQNQRDFFRHFQRHKNRIEFCEGLDHLHPSVFLGGRRSKRFSKSNNLSSRIFLPIKGLFISCNDQE